MGEACDLQIGDQFELKQDFLVYMHDDGVDTNELVPSFQHLEHRWIAMFESCCGRTRRVDGGIRLEIKERVEFHNSGTLLFQLFVKLGIAGNDRPSRMVWKVE